MDNLNYLTMRLINGAKARHKNIIINKPLSKISFLFLDKLIDLGFILSYKKGKNIIIFLKYGPLGEILIKNFKRISRGNLRTYLSVKDLWNSNNGVSILILTTTKGIMTDLEAKSSNLGGELLFILE